MREQYDEVCSGCDCPKARCDNYGYGRKCCPDCKHRRLLSTDPIAHLDWTTVRCQCEQHSDGCKSNCPNPATTHIEFHALDHCANTHDPDINQAGNYVFILCDGCLKTLRQAVDRRLTRINAGGRNTCLTCQAPARISTDIIRGTRPIEVPHA